MTGVEVLAEIKKIATSVRAMMLIDYPMVETAQVPATEIPEG